MPEMLAEPAMRVVAAGALIAGLVRGFAGSRLFGRTSEATYRRIAYGLITFVALATLPVFGGLIK